jgi:hypothetical protein
VRASGESLRSGRASPNMVAVLYLPAAVGPGRASAQCARIIPSIVSAPAMTERGGSGSFTEADGLVVDINVMRLLSD